MVDEYSEALYLVNYSEAKKNIKHLEAYSTSIEDYETAVEINVGKSGDKYSTVEYGSMRILLNSKYNPIAEAELWAEHIVNTDITLYVIFGVASGYRIRALLNKIRFGDRIVVIEPNVVFLKCIFGHYDVTDIMCDKKINWWAGDINQSFASFIEVNINQKNYNRIKTIVMPGYEELYGKSYRDFLVKMRNAVLSISQNISTRERYKFEWQMNVIKNLRSFVTSKTIMEVAGTIQKIPAVIVSSGPSLSKNIDVLSQYQDRVLIICASSSLKVLAKHNIKPDIVVSIHGDHHVFPSVEDIDFDDAILVYPMESYYKVQEVHKGDKIVIQSNVVSMKRLYEITDKEPGLIECGYSVANTAFSIASHLGADPIVFVGQDLAFEGKNVHADGVVSNAADKGYNTDRIEAEQRVTVKGVDGTYVESCYVFLTYLNWFQMKIADKPDRTYIDATEGGALIEGTEVMPLSEVVGNIASEVLDKELLKVSIMGEPIDVERSVIVDYINDMKSMIKGVKSRVQDAVKYNEALERYYDRNQFEYRSAEIRRIGAKLDKVDEYLSDSIEGLEFFGQLLVTVLREIYKLDEAVEDVGEKEKGLLVARSGHLLYDTILQAITYVTPLLDEVESYFKNNGEKY